MMTCNSARSYSYCTSLSHTRTVNARWRNASAQRQICESKLNTTDLHLQSVEHTLPLNIWLTVKSYVAFQRSLVARRWHEITAKEADKRHCGSWTSNHNTDEWLLLIHLLFQSHYVQVAKVPAAQPIEEQKLKDPQPATPNLLLIWQDLLVRSQTKTTHFVGTLMDSYFYTIEGLCWWAFAGCTIHTHATGAGWVQNAVESCEEAIVELRLWADRNEIPIRFLPSPWLALETWSRV